MQFPTICDLQILAWSLVSDIFVAGLRSCCMFLLSLFGGAFTSVLVFNGEIIFILMFLYLVGG